MVVTGFAPPRPPYLSIFRFNSGLNFFKRKPCAQSPARTSGVDLTIFRRQGAAVSLPLSAVNPRVLLSHCFMTITTAAFAAPGDVEVGFNPEANANVNGLAVQPDRRILLGGDFLTIAGGLRNHAARLLPDGSLDGGFDPDADHNVINFTVLPDGGTILGGDFNTMAGFNRSNLARFRADGILDTSWTAITDAFVTGTALQPDGQLVICGTFLYVNNTLRRRVARLRPDGSLDSFNPSASAQVRSVALQPDGRVLLAGTFGNVGGTMRNNIARVSSTGSLDTGFNPNPNGTVYCVAVQPDGRILMGGQFTSVGGFAQSWVARLLPDGTPDATFTPALNGLVRTMLLQADGAILCSGEFTSVNGMPRGRIARLQATGAVDVNFAPFCNDIIYSSALQADGRVLAGGRFTTANTLPRERVVRFSNSAAGDTLIVDAPGRVLWLRSGTAPEAQDTTFEYSTGGASSPWFPLGAGVRTGGGWERTSLNLAAAGKVRAKARVVSGAYNGSSGVVETVVTYNFAAIFAWRQTHFGTTQNTGPSANNADPDKDGLENLIEFAFGRNPNVPDAAALPQWVLADDDYGLTFTRPANVSGITYVAEYSSSLAPASWTPAVNFSTPPAYTFLAPAVTQRLYLRVRVTVP